MNIYVSHATSFDFRNELYAGLQQSEISKRHSLVLPHAQSDIPFNTKVLFEKKQCDVVFAEVSYPSTGQGIELGWADMFGIRIICASKKGMQFSRSLKVLSNEFIVYEKIDDLVAQLMVFL